jgi:hypothetical protein
MSLFRSQFQGLSDREAARAPSYDYQRLIYKPKVAEGKAATNAGTVFNALGVGRRPNEESCFEDASIGELCSPTTIARPISGGRIQSQSRALIEILVEKPL